MHLHGHGNRKAAAPGGPIQLPKARPPTGRISCNSAGSKRS